MPTKTKKPKRGRPFLPPDKRRAEKVQVRCTTAEWNRWIQASTDAGVSVPEYLRRCEQFCGDEIVATLIEEAEVASEAADDDEYDDRA